MAIPSSSSSLLDDPASLVESEPGSVIHLQSPVLQGLWVLRGMHRHSTFWRAMAPGLAIPLLGAVVLSQGAGRPNAATLQNPVAATPQSLADGKKAYDENCAACHGPRAEGSVKAGVIISIIQEQGGKQPPDLTDAQFDHGSTDGEIYTAIRKGVPPTMMAGWEGRISDTEIWHIVNYLRALAANPATGGPITVAPAAGRPRPPYPSRRCSSPTTRSCRSRVTSTARTRAASWPASTSCATSRAAAASSSTT